MGLLGRWDRRNADYLADVERRRREHEGDDGDGGPWVRPWARYQLAKLSVIGVLLTVGLVIAGLRAVF